MTTYHCDACGDEINAVDGHGAWQIALRFVSWWNPAGHVREMHLCSNCGSQAARLLGFCYDTGKILSIARGEQINDVTVYGPHGGGLEDIAIHGVGGANEPTWGPKRPNALPMGCMVREAQPWMRAQGYEPEFIAKYGLQWDAEGAEKAPKRIPS